MMKILEGKVDTSVRQICEAWRLMCRDASGRREAAADGIDYIFSGLPIPFFNVAVLTQPSISAAALRSFGDTARAWAAGTGETVPWFLIVTHEALETGVDAPAILGECGLVAALPLTGMLATRVASIETVPAGLRLGAAVTDSDCAAVLDINSAAYEMDLGTAKPVIGTEVFWKDHVAVLGKVDDVPVSSAAVMMVDGYRYVALVATDPAHRRHGYAEAVMRQALQTAAATHGELPSVLHATDAGRPIYERMGYSTISTHTMFMDAALLAGH
jgi:ribosomal protein S18 acetylase RimI-like enzyme